MKRIFTFIALIMLSLGVGAQNYKSMTWAQICSGKMGAEW